MILVLSTFLTNQRHVNRYSRYDIFKYMLYSYKNISFSEIYLFILFDNEFICKKEDMTNFIYKNFSNLDFDKIHITYDRYYKQEQWIPFINDLVEKHGFNELVWFTQNDDHVFIDFNIDILNEGLISLQNEPNPHKSLYFSHWPELLKISGRFQQPERINNYIKFNSSILDSIQIFSLKLLHFILVDYKWRNNNHPRIDTILCEILEHPTPYNPLFQTVYVPLRELVRHFDGYNHVNMDITACPPLEFPSNTFNYSKVSLIRKMTAYHNSYWTNNNNFQIPEEWIDINLSLHPNNIKEYSLTFNQDSEINVTDDSGIVGSNVN